MAVLERPSQLIGSCGAGDDDYTVLKLSDVFAVFAIDEGANGALKVTEVPGPEEAGLTRGDHRI